MTGGLWKMRLLLGKSEKKIAGGKNIFLSLPPHLPALGWPASAVSAGCPPPLCPMYFGLILLFCCLPFPSCIPPPPRLHKGVKSWLIAVGPNLLNMIESYSEFNQYVCGNSSISLRIIWVKTSESSESNKNSNHDICDSSPISLCIIWVKSDQNWHLLVL